MKTRSFFAFAVLVAAGSFYGCGDSPITGPDAASIDAPTPGLAMASDGEIQENPRIRSRVRSRLTSSSGSELARVTDRVVALPANLMAPDVDPSAGLSEAVTYTNWRTNVLAWVANGASPAQVRQLETAIGYVAKNSAPYPVQFSLNDLVAWNGFIGPDDGSLAWAMKASSPEQELRKLATYCRFLNYKDTVGAVPVA